MSSPQSNESYKRSSTSCALLWLASFAMSSLISLPGCNQAEVESEDSQADEVTERAEVSEPAEPADRESQAEEATVELLAGEVPDYEELGIGDCVRCVVTGLMMAGGVKRFRIVGARNDWWRIRTAGEALCVGSSGTRIREGECWLQSRAAVMCVELPTERCGAVQ